MGMCESVEVRDQRGVADAIERQIKEDEELELTIIKLLLLGC